MTVTDRAAAFIAGVQAVDAVIAALPRTAKGEGEVECPNCKGTLKYAFRRMGGGRRHISVSAKCQTAGCLEFRS